MSLVVYAAGLPTNNARVYFSGTTTLRKGQILCYKNDATSTDADPKMRLGQQVIAITSASKNLVAGFVSETDAGKTGPCYVEVIRPQVGDVFEAEVDGTADIAAGNYLEPDDTLGALIYDAAVAPGTSSFQALEAFTTDATKKVIRCYKWG